jgi:hypothetical protein
MDGLWQSVVDIIKACGPFQGLLLVVIFFLHWMVYRLYMQNIKGKQEEINRMAEDSKDLRKNYKELLELSIEKIKSSSSKRKK